MTAIPDNSRLSRDTDAMSTPSTESHPAVDRNAPAGTENSLGEESIRDSRPSTKDEVVEAKDAMPPGSAV